MIEVDIKRVKEHYEVFSKDTHEFLFSADNIKEVREELTKMEESSNE